MWHGHCSDIPLLHAPSAGAPLIYDANEDAPKFFVRIHSAIAYAGQTTGTALGPHRGLSRPGRRILPQTLSIVGIP